MADYWVFRVYPNRIVADAFVYNKFSVVLIGSNFPSFEEAIRHLVLDQKFPEPTHFTPPRFASTPEYNDGKPTIMDQFGWYVLCSDSQERWYHFVIVDHDLEQRYNTTHPLVEHFSHQG